MIGSGLPRFKTEMSTSGKTQLLRSRLLLTRSNATSSGLTIAILTSAKACGCDYRARLGKHFLIFFLGKRERDMCAIASLLMAKKREIILIVFSELEVEFS